VPQIQLHTLYRIGKTCAGGTYVDETVRDYGYDGDQKILPSRENSQTWRIDSHKRTTWDN